MELFAFLAAIITVIGGVATVIKLVHNRTGIGFAWLFGALTVVGAALFSVKVGLEPLAIGITIVSGLVGGFAYYRKKSLTQKIIIAVVVTLILLAMVWFVYIAIGVMTAVLEAVVKGVIEGIFEGLKNR